jgi:N,N'-diacetyllegionaminate synthase
MKHKTYILAEMASSHEGKEKIAEFIMEGASKAGADGILFQLLDLPTYIVPNDEDMADTKSFYMKQDIWARLIKKADSLGLDVWANVYDLASLHFCKGKKIRGFKLHSANIENEKMVREAVKMKKEMLLCVGGMEKQEVKNVLKLIYSADKKAKLTLMYGLQNFPTEPDAVNLNFVRDLSAEFKLPLGYQDHSEPRSQASTYLSVLAVSQGASVIEKHITHDRSLKGQDYEAALNPDEFLRFVRDIRMADRILEKRPKEVSQGEMKYRHLKSDMKAVALKAIKAGEVFSENNLTVMRAKKGELNGRELKNLFGRKAKKSYRKFEPVKRSEIVKVGIFITARLKSKRLPMKVIKPILGRPMVEWMIERLKHAGIDLIVMMTSTNLQDDPLIKIAKKNRIEWFRGSEEDVLMRLRDCARKFDVDLVINVTADDPLKEPLFIEKLVQRYLERKYDYCDTLGLPNGCESHGLTRKALEKICRIKKDTDTEIWAAYFTDTGMFKCDTVKVEDPTIYRPDYRITVDTPEDFKVVTEIYRRLSKKGYFNVYDICEFLDKNPELRKINSHIEQRRRGKVNVRKK